MEVREERVYAYWQFFESMATIETLWERKIIPAELYEKRKDYIMRQLRFEESLEKLRNDEYRNSLLKHYGTSFENCPIPSIQARYKARLAARVPTKYKYFTEIVHLHSSDISPSYALQCWLREKNTLEFMFLWESRHNKDFDAEQAKLLMEELRSSNSGMTLKKWIGRTGATGIVSLPGRYGGTYADPMIAKAFEIWLSPMRLYMLIDMYFLKNDMGLSNGGNNER